MWLDQPILPESDTAEAGIVSWFGMDGIAVNPVGSPAAL
jgi:hypothetical protein